LKISHSIAICHQAKPLQETLKHLKNFVAQMSNLNVEILQQLEELSSTHFEILGQFEDLSFTHFELKT
jgi:conjugal transfer/entry exclusion protein